MYRGTLVKDLMATVERAERSALRQRVAEELELLRSFDLEHPQQHSEPAYAGAA